MSSVSGTSKSIKTNEEPLRPALPLKYYIHDSIQALRFQLIGNLTQTNVAELSGCWNTAKTILGNRTLVIDIRALRSTDEAGKQWLLSLAHEGAQYLPESYFRSGLASPDYEAPRRIGILSRLVSVFRGRPLPAESSTRAQ